ncbi:hypothetical protein OC834_005420 [Tilletia horrida]|nr:hypothetical protein OC834_005420 [Tilletia horrida]
MAALFPLRSAAAAVASKTTASGLSRRIAAASSPRWTATPTMSEGSSSSSGSSRRALATISNDSAPPPNESPAQTQAREATEDTGSQEEVAAVQAEVAAAVSEAVDDAIAAAPLRAQLQPSSSHAINASLVISRPPLLLREPGEFERAFYAYNAKLKAALAQPFPRDFYFKKGSTAEQRFDDAEARRLGALQKGDTDPLSFIASSSSSSSASASSSSSEGASEKNPDAELYSTLPRTTEADKQNDIKSLNRKLDRTLYLLTRKGTDGHGKEDDDAAWTLPTRRVARTGPAKENLHQAAHNAVQTQLGDNIDVWLVSNLPIGVTKPASESDPKTYYMQAHVLSGNVASEDAEGPVEHAWLTREEIEERLTKAKQDPAAAGSWEQIRDFLRA